jgi:asparagine synthase (glutamine-hydrolysing)
MCGIVAIYAYKENAAPVSETELTLIRDSMIRRGPDGCGAWLSADGRIGLGHRRLAIIDPGDGGAQPMADDNGDLRITFNGEIYNFRALRHGLEQLGDRFRSNSDTEVLLQLYRRYGTDMLPMLRGMFAFALWDGTRQRLLVARDPLGIKPVYLADDGGSIRIASQVKALAAGKAVDTAVSPAGCVSFFVLGYVADPFTFHRAIRALPAGHFLFVDRNGPGAPQRYFSIAATLQAAEAKARDVATRERAPLLSSALSDAVTAHLVADVPVGVFLSAGLDSSCITALARDATAGVLRTMTLGFGEYAGTAKDEVPLAQELARRFAAEHRTTWIFRGDFEQHLDDILAAMDQPTIDGVNTYFISAAARRAGVKVALSGLGGDELFGGYAGFAQIPWLARLLSPLRGVPLLGRGFRIIASPLIGGAISPKYAGLLEYGTSVEDAYLLRRSLFMPWELPQLLDPDLVRAGWRELRPLTSLRETVSGLTSDRARIAALEMSWYMRCQLLRDADWAGMAHSVEIRTPFVDVELLQRLAPLIVGEQPPSKQEMAQAMPAPLLPAILARRKTGFVTPVRDWLIQTAGRAYRGRGLRGWSEFVFARFSPQAA